MSIKSKSIKLVKIANRICEENGLDIKHIITKDNHREFDEVWNKALKEFEKEEKEEVHFYKNDKWNQINKISRIENYLEQKKYELNFENSESTRGMITGLEIALTILR
jgi:adenylate kinase family enzyme